MACEKNLLHETLDTLSDPKTVPLEEREAKYNRFVSSMFLVLKFILDNMDTDNEFDAETNEKLCIVLADKKFWKFSKHPSPMVRTSFFILLVTVVEKLTTTMQGYLQQLATAVLTNLDEEDSVVTKAMWDCVLVTLATFDNIWECVNVRKAVWPKLWKLLGAGCHGNISIVYPSLLPLLSHVTPQVAGEGNGFYAQFFDSITELLKTKKINLCDTDTSLIMTTYMECIRYLLLKNIDNKELNGFIVGTLIAGKLTEVFHSECTTAWHELFFRELQLLLSHLCGESVKDSGFKLLYADVWKLIGTVVFMEDGGAFKFPTHEDSTKNLRPTFYTSLLKFLSFCVDSAETNESAEVVGFSQNVLKCLLKEVFGERKHQDGIHLMKVIEMSSNMDLLRFAYTERLRQESSGQADNQISNLETCKGFVGTLSTPLLAAGVDYEREIVNVTVSLVSCLHGNDKQNYLISLMEGDSFSNHVLLLLFAKVFEHSADADVLVWLKSDFVEREITNLCSPDRNSSENSQTGDISLVWNILGRYMGILHEDATKLSIYYNKLLVLIKDALLKGHRASKNVNEGVYSTFLMLCKSSTMSRELIETMYLVFQSNILLEETTNSVEAMNKSFALLMKEENVEQLKEMVGKMMSFVKEYCAGGVVCERLCATIFSLVLMAQYHSYIGDANESYGKIMLQEMVARGEADIADENVLRFFSAFLNIVCSDGFSLLQKCSNEKLHTVLLECYVSSVTNPDSTTNVEGCISKCEFLHFDILDMAVQRCLAGTIDAQPIKLLLETFVKNKKLSETIADHILMLSSPQKHGFEDAACSTYCMVVSVIEDISCVRALVEMYVDDLRCNTDITDNALTFSQFVKVLTSIVRRWHEVLKMMEIDDFSDYFDVIDVVVSCLLRWKEEHSDMLLFSTSFGDVDTNVISLNVHLIQLLHTCTRTALETFKAEQWDFLLCSMISWVQSCEESLDCFGGKKQLEFMNTAFLLFRTVAASFEGSPVMVDLRSVVPSVCVGEESNVVISSFVSDDTATEWKELFLPTAGTSLLRIYMHVLKTNCIGENFVKLEQALSKCIRYIPTVTIHEFACKGHESDGDKQKAIEEFCDVCYDTVASGSWWNKIGCYQLLTGMSELIESKLCYISQEEDEENEGMRSFPAKLVHTMEQSRDETLKVLSAADVSIKEPLHHLEDVKGKSDLFTYLLSWQLILQLFRTAGPGNRALFANYFHSNSDVHDLITCLFCMMSKTMNFEYKNNISLNKFNFQELSGVAFHLLTTSMECIPALIRNWFNNHVNRGDTGTVNKLVSTAISPILLHKEFNALNQSSTKQFNNMHVKTRPGVREIAAVYTVDEVSMELVVQLGANHPLSPVSVTCGKRIGVSNQLWRQWMLQLNTFLSFQNGSIMDGLVLWKRNVDKRFEGVEECMVCFSVLHGSNYSLPTIACKTCKKKFHPACLYKWFNTSGKCTCPLCRNTF